MLNTNDSIVKQFNEFRHKTGKYKGLLLEEVEFDRVSLKSLVDFNTGVSKYTKKYAEMNTGQFPLMTGSLEVKYYVDAIDNSHIIYDESVSYNKDNDAGSQAFYHKEPYIVGAHHYSLSIKTENNDSKEKKLTVRYLYYIMKNIFNNNKFYQSNNVANSFLIETFETNIPRDLNGYTSIEIQNAIVEFLDRTDTLRKNVDELDSKVQKVYDATLSKLFFKNDSYICEKFDQWAISESLKLKINDIPFDEKQLKDIADFPRMPNALGTPDLTIKEYQLLSQKEQENYVPLIGGTLDNNQISGYFHKKSIREKAISEPNVLSWSRLSGKHFFIQKRPVCVNDDSFFMKIKEGHLIEFVQASLIVQMKNDSADWGNKIGKAKMMQALIQIPEATEEYTSLEIQKIFLRFMEKYSDLKNRTLVYINSIIDKCDILDKVFLQQLFKDRIND